MLGLAWQRVVAAAGFLTGLFPAWLLAAVYCAWSRPAWFAAYHPAHSGQAMLTLTMLGVGLGLSAEVTHEALGVDHTRSCEWRMQLGADQRGTHHSMRRDGQSGAALRAGRRAGSARSVALSTSLKVVATLPAAGLSADAVCPRAHR